MRANVFRTAPGADIATNARFAPRAAPSLTIIIHAATTPAAPPKADIVRQRCHVRKVSTADAARQGVWSAIESQRVSTRWVASSVGTTSVTR